MTVADVLSSLSTECHLLVDRVIAQCAAAGLEMRPYGGSRDPVTQARLWRQSRSWSTISARIAELRQGGCKFIADCLTVAGPQSGPPVTNAIPGLSWHQFGQACDLVLVRDGVFIWDDRDAYSRFGAVVRAAHGKWGGDFGDTDHLQFYTDEPLAHFGTMKAVDAELQRLWPRILDKGPAR